jgi:hypothetical protein
MQEVGVLLDASSCIAQTEAIIDTAIRKYGLRDVLPQVVSYYAKNRDALKSLIDESIAKMEELLEKSFYHPLGFDKFVLLQGKEFSLRLHNFKPMDEGQPSEHVHNHKWEFASAILHGSFVSEVYEEAAWGIPTLRYLTLPTGTVFDANTYLQIVRRDVNSAGTQYYMTTDVLHSVTDVAPEGAISIIAKGHTDERASTTVYLEEELDPVKESKYTTDKDTFSVQTLIDTMNRVKSLCCK